MLKYRRADNGINAPSHLHGDDDYPKILSNPLKDVQKARFYFGRLIEKLS